MINSVRIYQLLNTIQRIVLLKITIAYSTSATAALQVLAGILPLDITYQIKQLYYRLKFHKKPIKLDSENLEYNNVDWETTEFYPPWDSFRIPWNKSDNKKIMIYTDGSKLSNKLGFAFIVIKDSQIVYTQIFNT